MLRWFHEATGQPAMKNWCNIPLLCAITAALPAPAAPNQENQSMNGKPTSVKVAAIQCSSGLGTIEATG
jgi:hypothetical protein